VRAFNSPTCRGSRSSSLDFSSFIEHVALLDSATHTDCRLTSSHESFLNLLFYCHLMLNRPLQERSPPVRMDSVQCKNSKGKAANPSMMW